MYLKNKKQNRKICGYYPHKMLNEHYGLEIKKWFNVELPKQPCWITLVLLYYYVLKKIFNINKVDQNMRICEDEKKPIIYSFKQNLKYYDSSWNIVFNIIPSTLSSRNLSVLQQIQNSNSVFVHIRRGDYLSEKYKNKYEGTCTKEYYKKAIDLITEKMQKVRFFCFSDDIEWVKSNLKIHAVYIDWNKGTDSPIDMFLMSNCKGGIIANSTFSYWAAMLAKDINIVTYPQKWENSNLGAPDIFPNNWIGL